MSLPFSKFAARAVAGLLLLSTLSSCGGTAATVRYARKLGRGLTVIDPLTLRISNEEVLAGGETIK